MVFHSPFFFFKLTHNRMSKTSQIYIFFLKKKKKKLILSYSTDRSRNHAPHAIGYSGIAGYSHMEYIFYINHHQHSFQLPNILFFLIFFRFIFFVQWILLKTCAFFSFLVFWAIAICSNHSVQVHSRVSLVTCGCARSAYSQVVAWQKLALFAAKKGLQLKSLPGHVPRALVAFDALAQTGKREHTLFARVGKRIVHQRHVLCVWLVRPRHQNAERTNVGNRVPSDHHVSAVRVIHRTTNRNAMRMRIRYSIVENGNTSTRARGMLTRNNRVIIITTRLVINTTRPKNNTSIDILKLLKKGK